MRDLEVWQRKLNRLLDLGDEYAEAKAAVRNLENIKGVKPSTGKLVLLCMAGVSKPFYFGTLAALAKETGLDRKAVVRAVSALEALGVIERTGTKRGQTRQIVEYQFAELSTEFSTKEPQSGTDPKVELFPINPETGPKRDINRSLLGLQNLRTNLIN